MCRNRSGANLPACGLTLSLACIYDSGGCSLFAFLEASLVATMPAVVHSKYLARVENTVAIFPS
jgi:hypothetical protein